MNRCHKSVVYIWYVRTFACSVMFLWFWQADQWLAMNYYIRIIKKKKKFIKNKKRDKYESLFKRVPTWSNGSTYRDFLKCLSGGPIPYDYGCAQSSVAYPVAEWNTTSSFRLPSTGLRDQLLWPPNPALRLLHRPARDQAARGPRLLRQVQEETRTIRAKGNNGEIKFWAVMMNTEIIWECQNDKVGQTLSL
jgi:hypothetical protein